MVVHDPIVEAKQDQAEKPAAKEKDKEPAAEDKLQVTTLNH